MDDVRPIPPEDTPAASPPSYGEPVPGFGPNWAVLEAWMEWDALPESERPFIAPGDNPAGLPVLPLPPRPMSPGARRFVDENRDALEAWNRWDGQDDLFNDVFGDLLDGSGLDLLD